MNQREQRKLEHRAAQRRAVAAFETLDPDADDATLAGIIAEYLVTWTDGSYNLSINHDVRPSSPKRITSNAPSR
jgi:hypothetical protein